MENRTLSRRPDRDRTLGAPRPVPPVTARAFLSAVGLLALLILAAAACTAERERPLPVRQGAVNDFSGVLPESAVAALEEALKEYERETCHQIVVVILPSLEGESIGELSSRIMKAWGVGPPPLENGVLVILSLEEGVARIDAGQGLERLVASGSAEVVLNRDMLPLFKENRIGEGLTLGIESIMKEGRSVAYPPELQPPVCRSE